MRKLFLGMTVAMSLMSTGCIVHERARCPGAVWVEGFRDRWGRWHPAHWRCAGEYY